jgi:hypothetical protein
MGQALPAFPRRRASLRHENAEGATTGRGAGGLTLASGLLGFLIQWLLPVQALSDGRAMVGSIIGLVTVLLALVLGLLVWTSYGVYTKQVDESQSLGPVVLQLILVHVEFRQRSLWIFMNPLGFP